MISISDNFPTTLHCFMVYEKHHCYFSKKSLTFCLQIHICSVEPATFLTFTTVFSRMEVASLSGANLVPASQVAAIGELRSLDFFFR